MKKFLSILLCLILVMGIFTVGFADDDPEESCCPPGRITTLTIGMVGEGEVDPEVGIHEFDCCRRITVTASDTDCWEFVRWEGDFGPGACGCGDHPWLEIDPTDPSLTVFMCFDRDITAVFQLKTRYLTVTSEGPGTTTPAGVDLPYDCGELVDIIASPAVCGYFDHWEGDIGRNSATDPSISVPMNEDRDIHAVFGTIQYTLGVSHTEGGTTVPTAGAHVYDCGTVVDLEAIPNECWAFDHWEGDVASSSSAITTVTMDASKRVRAVFVSTCPCEEVELYVYVYEGNGAVSPAGTTVHCVGDEVALLATPDPGWEFVTWRGGDGGITSWLTEASSVIMPEGGTTVAAVFAPVATSGYCTLTVTSHGPGATDQDGVSVVTCGTVVSIIATPEEGSRFVEWTGDYGDNGASDPTISVIMNRDRDIDAWFEYTLFTLTVNSEGNGTTEPAGTSERIYENGDDVLIIASPASGCWFVEWEGDGVATPASMVTEVTINGDTEVTAVFRCESSSSTSYGGIYIQHTLSISIDGNGTVDPFVGSKKYLPGTIVNVGADPAEGWTFVGWFGPDGGSVVNDQITMNDDKTLIAHFEETAPPPVEPPEIEIPLVETPLSGGDLPDTSQAMPLANLFMGFYLVGLGIATKKNKR